MIRGVIDYVLQRKTAALAFNDEKSRRIGLFIVWYDCEVLKQKESRKLQYKTHGNGDNVIVLIHGFLASSRYWSKLRPSLVRSGYRVICIDLLGFGRAAKPNNIAYSYNDQVEYIHDIIHTLDLTNPFTLVGHSMGALISARYAVHYPHEVSELILLHPPLYSNSTEANFTLRDTGLIYRYLLDSKYRHVGWNILSSSVVRVVARHTHFSRELSLKNIILKTELLADLADIRVRTLLLVGLRDRPIYQDNLRHIDNHPAVEVIKKDVGHHSVLHHPGQIHKMIMQFIQSSSIS